jgi:hypothetical protein
LRGRLPRWFRTKIFEPAQATGRHCGARGRSDGGVPAFTLERVSVLFRAMRGDDAGVAGAKQNEHAFPCRDGVPPWLTGHGGVHFSHPFIAR